MSIAGPALAKIRFAVIWLPSDTPTTPTPGPWLLAMRLPDPAVVPPIVLLLAPASMSMPAPWFGTDAVPVGSEPI